MVFAATSAFDRMSMFRYALVTKGGKPMRTTAKWLPLLAALAMATTASAASSKMTCTLSGKEVAKCCCEMQKDGKMLCTLTKKTVDKCCCKGM
jgi:hypothetical protein